MLTYQSSTRVAASRRSVWDLLAEVSKWPAWLPTVVSVEPLDGQALRLGARYKIIQPKLRPATWTVVALEPPQRFGWEIRLPGLRVVADHIVDEPSPGRSTVILRISFSGFMGAAVGRLTRSITERYLVREASALKFKVEGANASEAEFDREPAHNPIP